MLATWSLPVKQRASGTLFPLVGAQTITVSDLLHLCIQASSNIVGFQNCGLYAT